MTKAAVGPRYGFIAGWCLALVYVTFVGTLVAGFLTFVNLLLDRVFPLHDSLGARRVRRRRGGVWLEDSSMKLSTRVFLIYGGVSRLS